VTEVKPGQTWSSYAGAEKTGRHFFEIVSIDESRLSCAVRYEGERKRGGHKSLTTLRMGLRGSRLEKDSDGTPPDTRKQRPTVARASHYSTLAQRSTASDYRRLVPPKWMTPAEKRRWLANGGRDDDLPQGG
jgi:hypothetical protein